MQIVRVDGYCWVQKSSLTSLQLSNLRRELTVKPKKTSEYADSSPEPIPLYSETDTEFGIAREFYKSNAKVAPDYEMEVSDGAPMRPECLSAGFTGITGGNARYDEQTNVVTMMVALFKKMDYGGGILQAGCAFGKTNSALRVALGLGRRTIILVHKEFLLKQWKARIEEFFPGAKVGICRQNKCEWRGYDFTIALVQSLAVREYEPEFYSAFGLLVGDELHRVGAQSWAPIIPRFDARLRLGLTATPRRADGAERVFFEHVGPITYKATSPPLPFMVSRVDIPFSLKPISRGSYYVPTDQLTSSQVNSQIADDAITTGSIASSVAAAVKIGRKCFIVSTSLDQLWNIQEELKKFPLDPRPTVGWVTGSTFTLDANGNRFKAPKKVKNRTVMDWKMRSVTEAELAHADTCQVMLATKQMIEEAYDCQAIDVVYLATPINDVEQTVGRGRRPCEPNAEKCPRLCPWRAGICKGKPVPVIKDYVHSDVPRLLNRALRRIAFYKSEGADIK